MFETEQQQQEEEAEELEGLFAISPMLVVEEEAEELEKWTFCHISHVSGPILTKF